MHFCEICNYITTSLHDYKRHLATVKHKNINIETISNKIYTNEINLICPTCNKKYIKQRNLEKHEIKCHLKKSNDIALIKNKLKNLQLQHNTLKLKIINNMQNANTINNINNINNNINNINNINNTLISQESTQKAKTNIDKFLQFADKYKKDYKIPENLLLKLRTKKVSEIVNLYTCSKNPSKTTIQINSDGYSDFKKSYQKLKQHYLDSTTSLLSIMENKLLDKTNDNDNTQYKIKNITDKQLNNIQIEVMTELTNYYTNCQTYYEESFQILANSLTPEELYNNI